MTIQAYAWAIEQPVPGTAKLVLQAMANHADHTNGYVHFDAATIAREASIEVPSLWRYLGVLDRNGYLSKDERKPGATDKRDYWLVLDRNVNQPWSWSAQDQGSEDADQSAAPIESGPPAAPKSFRRAEQDKAREVPPPTASPGVPIIEGSKAYVAWCDHHRNVLKRPAPFVQSVQTQDGKWLRGFYMPTLFPPRQDQIDNLEGAA